MNLMTTWKSFADKAKELIKNGNYAKAIVEIEKGLRRAPGQKNLLILASTASRRLGNRKKSLRYANLLILHCPSEHTGYIHSAQDLIALKRFSSANKRTQEGLRQNPNHGGLLKIDAYARAFLGDNTTTISGNETERLRFNYQDIICYCKVPGIFEMLKEKQMPRPSSQLNALSSKRILFVTGLGRSGTTALGKMLNISSLIELYTELYPSFRPGGYSLEDFLPENIEEKVASNPLHPQNLEIFKKHKTSTLIGDKRPAFQFMAELTSENFGDKEVKTIFIDRSLVDVCRSSHKRSVSKSDNWPLERGIEFAILAYNASCRQIMHLHENKANILSDFMFVRYEDVFTNKSKAYQVFEYLGISLSDEESKELDVFIRKSSDIACRERRDNPDLEEYIKECILSLLDMEAHEHFCAIAGISRHYF